MSMKDLCTIDMIPELVEAGIDSFKIEGRMKQPDYVYTVTQMYRKYTDIYLQKGKKGFMSQRRTKKSWKIVTAEEGTVMGTTESRTEKRCFL